MLLRLLFGSYLLFGIILISLLWGDRWLPPNVGIAVLACIVTGWFITAYFLFRHLGLPIRAKIVGWLSVASLVGYSIARRFSSYYFYHDSWSLMFAWDAVGILIVAIWLGLAVLILPKTPIPSSATPYTVESETPDHVLHVNPPNT